MEPTSSPVFLLAQDGRTDDSASARATGEIEIDADRGTVWKLLAHVKNWPSIRADVTDVEAIEGDGPERFRWLAGGIPVESAFALVEQPSRLNWANVAPGMEMSCVYAFEKVHEGRTRVRCAESMHAPVVAPQIDDDVLKASIQSWLEGLKLLAEQKFAKNSSR